MTCGTRWFFSPWTTIRPFSALLNVPMMSRMTTFTDITGEILISNVVTKVGHVMTLKLTEIRADENVEHV